jgi:hypothetical protein
VRTTFTTKLQTPYRQLSEWSPGEVDANRFAQLPGGRMPLKDSANLADRRPD